MESRGRYELLRCLGRGGMAEVFLARFRGPHGFERVVVVKRVLPQLAKESVFVRRLIDEARVAARLHHENIVQVLELGDDHGMPFLALELVEGRDLFVVLDQVRARKERMPVPHVVTAVRGVLAALAHAHARGVVHRDVSSSNVIVSYQGGVKLIDFGIARARDSLSLTRPGAILGKAMYMSPEQQRGLVVDGRADVYAVGVLLHLMLANDGPSPSASGASRVSDAVPASLRSLVARALAEEPDARYTADEMLAALDAWTARTATPVSTAALGAWLRAFMPPEESPIAAAGVDEAETGTRSAVRPAEGHIDSSLASLVDGDSVMDDDGDGGDGDGDEDDEDHDGESVLDPPPIISSTAAPTVASPLRALLATQETPQQQPPRRSDTTSVTGPPAQRRESARAGDTHDEPTRILESNTPAWRLSNAPTASIPLDDARTVSTSSASSASSDSSDSSESSESSDSSASLAALANAATTSIPTPSAPARVRTASVGVAAAVGVLAVVVFAVGVVAVARQPAPLVDERAPAAPTRPAPPIARSESTAAPLAPVAAVDPVAPVAPVAPAPERAPADAPVDAPLVQPEARKRERIARVDRRDTKRSDTTRTDTTKTDTTKTDATKTETSKSESESENTQSDVTKSDAPAAGAAATPAEGELSVRTTPAGARVLVDGREVGITPLRRLVPVGAHEITLIAPSGARRQLPISVRANKVSDVNLKLD